ncbi:MAG: FHA domain-containing protein [Actinomycetales bacterium]|nr:FHA domain-containing protein [Actinomycetales bacterium]
MELLLVVTGPSRTPREVRVEVDPASPAAELLAALRDATGGVGEVDGWVSPTGARIDPARPVAELGLAHGDTVELTVPGTAPTGTSSDATRTPAAFELCVAAGPGAGRREPLVAGRGYLVGRDASADIVLDDERISRRHLHLGVGSKSVVATDAGSSNGSFLDGSRLDEPTPVLAGQVVEIGSTQLTIEPARGTATASVRRADGRDAFSRPPRVARPDIPRRIQVPAPPQKPPRRRIPLSAALVPVLVGGVLAYFLGPVMLLFALMGPLVLVASTWEDRRSGRRDYATRRAAYETALAQLSDQVDGTYRDLLAARRADAPNLAELAGWVHSRSPRLWKRRPDDTDFLTVRIGTADLPSRLVVDVAVAAADPDATPDPADLERAEELARTHATDPAVPVDVGLPTVGVLGVAGDPTARDALLRWIAFQAAALHSPKDLAIVGLLPDDGPSWSWLRWLPHTETLLQGLPGGRSVACQEDDVRALFQVVDDLVVQRRLRAERGVGDQTAHPVVLVVVPGPIPVPRPALSRLMADGPRHGVLVVVGAGGVEQLPGECRAVVDAAGPDGSVTLTATGDTVPGVRLDALGSDQATDLGRRMAPLRDASASSASGEVPRRVLLLDLLGLPEPDPDAIRRRWSDHAGTGDLGAPLGEGAAGPVVVDLRRDGPHGLTAGTTGSGKSELLQAWIGALAATHPASALTFVLIDYKGGAAFKDCVDLPHTVGFFTDLDAHLASRALVSLNAELRRREEILREHSCKDLPELEQRFPAAAPASLFLVFDEFAFLKKEVPQFVSGVIDIAQRGRSLGVHLMLATQRPAGVVDDSIRANTNLRIALRMADEQDSSDVLDRPDAARIPKGLPGRGYVRLGHTDVTLVQSAYASARSQQRGATRQPTTVTPFEVRSGLRATSSGVREVHDERPTDLQRLVTAIRAAHVAAGVPDQPRPWLDPLPDRVDLADLLDAAAPAGLTAAAAPLGLVDRPERQARDIHWYDPEVHGHVLVFGTGGAGKTQLLRTVAASLAARLDPADIQLYGLDFAGRGLAPLVALPQVGGVVAAEESERVDRLFDMLDALVARRTRRLSEAAASNLAELRAGGGRLPYVVVLLDGFAAFRQTYLNVDRGELVERFDRLVARGRAVGVTFVVTADRPNAVPSTLSSAVSERVVLRMAEGNDYASLGLPSALADTTLPPGRGFAQGSEVQIAMLGDDASGAGQALALERLGATVRSRPGGADAVRPPAVEVLGDDIRTSDLPVAAPTLSAVPIGISGISHGPVGVDMGEDPVFAVLGPALSGRTTTLETLTAGLVAARPELECYLLAPRRTPLAERPWWHEVARGTEASDDLARRLADQARERRTTPGRPWLVVVDDGDELVDSPNATALSTLIRTGRDLDLVVLAALGTHTAHRAFGGWATDLRKGKHGIVLTPDVDTDGDLFGLRFPRRASRRFPAGRGLLVDRGIVDYVQVARLG